MRFYEAEATIAAQPERIWSILIDGDRYPEWGSGVTRLEGTIASGQKVKVYSEVTPGRAFPVRVDVDQERGVMTWRGGMPFGLFTGIRTFTVTEVPDGCHFRMREEFTGPMLGLIWRSMPDLGPSFDTFVRALKAQAERK